MNDAVLLADFSNMDLVDFHYHIDWQWDSARIEVRNFEQDPGITFLALSMETGSDS